MATVFEFDCRTKIWQDFRRGRWLATSEHIPLYAVADSREQLAERVDQSIAVFCDYVGEKYSAEEIEAYLASRGTNPKRYSSSGEATLKLAAKQILTMAGER